MRRFLCSKFLRLGKRKQDGQVPSSAFGFTAAEIVVMLTIITAISAQVLFSFTGLNEGASLHRSAQELGLAIRRAQNLSLAVRGVRPGDPPGALVVPDAVGIRLVPGSAEYIIFADHNPRDNIYSGASEIIGKPATFIRHVTIRTLTPTSQGGAHIILAAPEAAMTFWNNDASASLGDKLTIELRAPSGQTATVEVRTSGQVSIR